jgi:hypothetical protein
MFLQKVCNQLQDYRRCVGFTYKPEVPKLGVATPWGARNYAWRGGKSWKIYRSKMKVEKKVHVAVSKV